MIPRVTAALGAIASIAVLGIAAAPAGAQLLFVPTGPPVVDLLTDAPVQIDGELAGDSSGFAVGGDFDFNDDGRLDVLVGAPYNDGLNTNGGSAWGVFGPPASLVDLANTGSAATQFEGRDVSNYIGYSVSDAGDVNGDGIDDVIIGGVGHDPSGRTDAGAAWVVFGDATPSDKTTLGPSALNGFRIEGAATLDSAGYSVSGAGNVNGDEYDDVIVGAPIADPLGRSAGGIAYVVFGKPGIATVDLAALGVGGYEIRGATSGDGAGWSVANAGDVNLDGRPDQLVGAPNFDVGTGTATGAAYVVEGKANTTPIDLNALGPAGYRIEGEAAPDYAGHSVDNAGDVNQDGRPDQLIGAPSANAGVEGAAYVVHGQASSSTIPLSTLSAGYELKGALPDERVGASVAGLGDISGDGVPDHVVGAPEADNGGRSRSGSAYVVHGKSGTSDVDLIDYDDGYRVDGAAVSDRAGTSVSAPGNVGGASTRDVLIGAPGGDANGRGDSGSTYVIYGDNRFRFAVIGNISINFTRIIALGARSEGATAARGGRIRYQLSTPATVRMRIQRIRRGRTQVRAIGEVRCVRGRPPRGRSRRSRVCRRFRTVGQVVRNHGEAGSRRVTFTGRVGGRALKPGRYRFEITARDLEGRVHGPAHRKFRVLPG